MKNKTPNTPDWRRVDWRSWVRRSFQLRRAKSKALPCILKYNIKSGAFILALT